MFQSARLKLTGWYLLIIMAVSLLFSVIIYTRLSGELEFGFRRAEQRFKRGQLNLPLPPQFHEDFEELSLPLKEDLRIAKTRIIFNLLFINGIILVISSAAGYFLAGRTLTPIEKAVEEQKRFIADASHEFRTPLTSLKTSMEVALRDKKISLKEAKGVISEALPDIDNLQDLSGNLLSLANLQGNGKNILFEELDIKDIVQKAGRKILPLAKEKGVDLTTEVESISFYGNKQMIEEVILIFLDNGIKYTAKGGKVAVKIEKDKRHLIIKITDTGIGIAKKDLTKIFDRFFRVDQSRNTPGFGLGLSLAKRTVEIHHGEIITKSALGKGTEFIIRLPLKHS